MRNLPITNNLIALTLFSLVFILCGIGAVVHLLMEDRRGWDTRDSVQVISMTVADLLQNGSTQAEIDDRVRQLIQGSVINAGLDAQQRPIDEYGMPFRIRHTVEGMLHRVTATSAGPDRHFDTPDDIRHDATWETLKRY